MKYKNDNMIQIDREIYNNILKEYNNQNNKIFKFLVEKYESKNNLIIQKVNKYDRRMKNIINTQLDKCEDNNDDIILMIFHIMNMVFRLIIILICLY